MRTAGLIHRSCLELSIEMSAMPEVTGIGMAGVRVLFGPGRVGTDPGGHLMIGLITEQILSQTCDPAETDEQQNDETDFFQINHP